MVTLVRGAVWIVMFFLLTNAMPRITKPSQPIVGILSIIGAIYCVEALLEVVKNVFNR